ncbi:hypothetical protein Tery_4253 [Trichodesmium erythraeum IMS101]|uniref:Uncharacterized protein n=2 Tax=Trichodesmium erythraeum TaxID=1206 RepID=Q10WX2_TRIEI
MIEDNNAVVSISSDFKKFLEITKTHNDNFFIMLDCSHKFKFIKAVVEALEQYGDVFAAYVNTINPGLPQTEKEELVYNFSEVAKRLTVKAVKVDKDYPDHDWKDSSVDVVYGDSKISNHLGYTYIFTENPDEATAEKSDEPSLFY